jgi:hypothetical protein
MKQLRADMKQTMYAVAKNTGKTSEQLKRWEFDGLPDTRVVA